MDRQIVPESCGHAAWTLPRHNDAAWTPDPGRPLHLIANDGQPRVLASTTVPWRAQRWLPLVWR